MVDRLPSLDFLLDVVQLERDKQLSHYDALDNKAGMVLAFSGLLITLSPDVAAAFRVLGVVSATVSAAFALWAFWPRQVSVLEPSPLRDYLRAEESFTRLTVLDTVEDLINETSTVLHRKAQRLAWALLILTAAASIFAMGIVVKAI